MGSDKPNHQIRKPPADDDVNAFIEGGVEDDTADTQTSGNSDVQTSERTQTTVYLDPEVKRKLKARCNLEDREMSAFVNDLIADELEGWTPDL